MKKRILIALILFFFLSTFISQKNIDFFSRFEVKEIFIENNQVLSDEDVRKELSFLYKKNLFSLKIGHVCDFCFAVLKSVSRSFFSSAEASLPHSFFV